MGHPVSGTTHRLTRSLRSARRREDMTTTGPAGNGVTRFLRGCPGLQAGEESDTCGAGQEKGVRPQGERPSGSVCVVLSGNQAGATARCENQARATSALPYTTGQVPSRLVLRE